MRSVFSIGLGLLLGAGVGCWGYADSHCANLDGDTTCAERGAKYCNFCEAAHDGCMNVLPSDGCHYSGTSTGMSNADGFLASSGTSDGKNGNSVGDTSGSGDGDATTQVVLDGTDLDGMEGEMEMSGSTTHIETGGEGGHPYVGVYMGTWEGDCFFRIDGTLSFAVFSDRTLMGSNDLEEPISGSVGLGGFIDAAVESGTVGVGTCSFQGNIEDPEMGVAGGTWWCPEPIYECSGEWSTGA